MHSVPLSLCPNVCCRYHLTDLPSFVSGQHLVLFDPHARFLPGASAAQPGLRVNLQRGRLLQQFPDAFAPYMHFGCTMEVRLCGWQCSHFHAAACGLFLCETVSVLSTC